MSNDLFFTAKRQGYGERWPTNPKLIGLSDYLRSHALAKPTTKPKQLRQQGREVLNFLFANHLINPGVWRGTWYRDKKPVLRQRMTLALPARPAWIYRVWDPEGNEVQLPDCSRTIKTISSQYHCTQPVAYYCIFYTPSEYVTLNHHTAFVGAQGIPENYRVRVWECLKFTGTKVVNLDNLPLVCDIVVPKLEAPSGIPTDLHPKFTTTDQRSTQHERTVAPDVLDSAKGYLVELRQELQRWDEQRRYADRLEDWIHKAETEPHKAGGLILPHYRTMYTGAFPKVIRQLLHHKDLAAMPIHFRVGTEAEDTPNVPY